MALATRSPEIPRVLFRGSVGALAAHTRIASRGGELLARAIDAEHVDGPNDVRDERHDQPWNGLLKDRREDRRDAGHDVKRRSHHRESPRRRWPQISIAKHRIERVAQLRVEL